MSRYPSVVKSYVGTHGCGGSLILFTPGASQGTEAVVPSTFTGTLLEIPPLLLSRRLTHLSLAPTESSETDVVSLLSSIYPYTSELSPYTYSAHTHTHTFPAHVLPHVRPHIRVTHIHTYTPYTHVYDIHPHTNTRFPTVNLLDSHLSRSNVYISSPVS